MGTLVIGLIIAAIVAAIIVSQIKNKKKGRHSCGGNCAHCASRGNSCSSSPADGLHRLILEIDGMMCPMCESHVNDAIRNKFSVKMVKSSFKTGICSVTSEEELDPSAIEGVLKESGYTLKKSTVIS